MKVIQTPFNVDKTPENRLRLQAFNIASLDEQMQVIEVHRVETSETATETNITGKFVGEQARPVHAFLINYECHGYGKFVVDPMTLTALETGLHKIESSRERKNTLNILYDQCKSGTVPAARVLRIITNNIEHETAVDVLQDTLRFIVPCILNNYLQEEVWESKKSQMFDLVMRILHSGRFEEYPSAIETLVTSAVSFAVKQSEVVLVSKWFQAGKIFDSEGATIRGASINV